MIHSSFNCTTVAQTPRVTIYSTLKLNPYPLAILAKVIISQGR